MSNKREPPFRWLKIREAEQSLNISKSSVRRIMAKMECDDKYKCGVIRCGGIVRVRKDMLTNFALGGNCT